MTQQTLRLSTDAPVGHITAEQWFRLERPVHMFLGPDESFAGVLSEACRAMLERTTHEWHHWVRGLATPVEWQAVVIRAAIT